MKDEGDPGYVTATAQLEGFAYSLALSATEMQAGRIAIAVDAVGVLDTCILIETYGHANAQFPTDLAVVTSDVAAIKSSTDNLPADPAGVSDLPVAPDNAKIASIEMELQSVLYDISGRADFLTTVSQVVTSEGTAEYDEPAGLKHVYECFIAASLPMEEKTYRDYLAYLAEDGSAGEPTMYARRHGKLYFWPVPDGVYTVNVDHARHHPEEWTNVLFAAEFDEAIFEGVLAALYKGQLFEMLRLNGKKVSSRDIAESVTETLDGTTMTDKDGTVDDVTVTVDDDATASVTTDDDSDVLEYEFSKDFPEIKLHERLYEAEIAKLIANMKTEMVLIEYRDI